MELKKVFGVNNIMSLLDETKINDITDKVITGYEEDDQSLEEWKKRNKAGMDLAMQILKEKNFPFKDSANVMYPLLSIAAIQFASRALPNLVPGWDIVRGKVIGEDPDGRKADKVKRVMTHMNYQLNEEMVEWKEETDKLLTVISIIGCVFKKTYFSKNLKRNISTVVFANDLVMNYKAKSMDTVPRMSEKYNLYYNEIIERIRSGIFTEYDIGESIEKKDEEDQDETIPRENEYSPYLFLEQHTWLDLDNDGYMEPYVVNIDYSAKKVVRIAPRFTLEGISLNDKNQISRIEPKKFYTKFSFIPSLDGSIYDLGFGSLLSPIGHTVNTTINQLLDSGTWSNAQSGFLGKGLTLGRGRSGGPLEIAPNEWIPVAHSGDDLRKNIVPLPTKEPSSVLFNLLGFMVQAGKELSSVNELMMGEQSVHNEPATTSLARIEQGLKVYSAIHMRLHRAFGKEYKLLFDLNSDFLNPTNYYTILDDKNAGNQDVMKDDYDKKSCDIIPTSSPEDISSTQKMIKAQALMGLLGTGFNDDEIKRRYIEALQIPDHESILEAKQPAPDPKLVLESEKLDLERSKFEFEMMKFGFEMAKLQSEIILNLAKAESEELGPQLEQYKAQMQALVSMSTKAQGAKNANNGK